MVKRSPEAESLLAQLDSELADSASRAQMELSWTAAEREILGRIAATIDRRTHLHGRYENCDPQDFKNLVRLSCEIRQCDALVARLLRSVSTDAPGATRHESQATRQARHAARKRWNPGAVS
ncbi:hypothetical protein [Mycobacterium seoulense]|uniref:hypothetical protein n=1 Tax=Mycobacterium seoulense TaxID=386911 RepID=UPI003CEB58B9